MDRCPNCKARYRDGEVCRRCGIEFVRLLEIEQQAELLRAKIANTLRTREFDQALKYVNQHRQLMTDPFMDHIHRFLQYRYPG